jgi:hypothetical protein
MKNRRRKSWVLAVLALTALAAKADALPLGLPGPNLPNLPAGSVIGRAGDAVDSTLATVRRDLAGRPVVSSARFDRDPNGARVVRHEVLAVAPTDQSLAIAQAQGFEVLRTDTLGALGLTVVVLRAPSDSTDALKTLRAADPSGTYEYDHIYDPSGDIANASAAQTHAAPALKSGTVGIVDGGIDRKHSVFADANIVTFNAVSKTDVPSAHGTAVASLLVGNRGAAPDAKLYAADVFGGEPNGGSAAAIVRGLAWLAQNEVPVINVSLSGPQNAVVGAAVKALVARGFVIVAAVGNDGPAVPVTYPAAYDGVVAVTSVDNAHRIQIDANRGPAVMFAAFGVGVRAAKPGGGYATLTGTSFAAPIVAANLASLIARPNVAAAAAARKRLEDLALDLGAPGRDPVYGYGFLAAPGSETQTAVR